MTRAEFERTLRRHPREAIMLALATQIMHTAPDPGSYSVLAVAWALGAARRWATGEASSGEVAAARSAVYSAYNSAVAIGVSDIAYACYLCVATSVRGWPGDWSLAVHSAIDAAASASTSDSPNPVTELVPRLPSPGRWGPWHQGRVIARAGDYLWRESEGRFVARVELTHEEAVDLDEIEERCG